MRCNAVVTVVQIQCKKKLNTNTNRKYKHKRKHKYKYTTTDDRRKFLGYDIECINKFQPGFICLN